MRDESKYKADLAFNSLVNAPSKNRHKVWFRGQVFDSIVDCAGYFRRDASPATLSNWVKRGYTPDYEIMVRYIDDEQVRARIAQVVDEITSELTERMDQYKRILERLHEVCQEL